MRAKWFCCAFKLGFLQLIYQASLIFKLYLELGLSVLLKERKFYKSKHVAVNCRCLKIWDLLSFFKKILILILKWRPVSPVWIELQLAQVNLSTKKDFKSSGIGFLCEKQFLYLKEVKTGLTSDSHLPKKNFWFPSLKVL